MRKRIAAVLLALAAAAALTFASAAPAAAGNTWPGSGSIGTHSEVGCC
ncbi:hypothetical protein [Glycomyces albidus]|jgi:hypothetical protein|nr:hypothetical protein [Glycomyces albidus]